MPLRHLVLDIETANGRPEAAEREMRMAWSPDPRWKSETIGDRWKAALETKLERLALLDEAPVAVVAMKSDAGLALYHTLYGHPERVFEGAATFGFADQRAMLVQLRALLDESIGEGTVVVGHNLLGFDLRKLRWAYVRAGLRMPVCLADHGQAVYDTMVEYGRRFSTARDSFVALQDLLEVFGVESHKGDMTGALVPGLIEQGQHDLVLRYAVLEVLAEEALYLRMTGQAEDSAPLPGQPPDTAAPAPATAAPSSVLREDRPAAPAFNRSATIVGLRERAKSAPFVRAAAEALGLATRPLTSLADSDLIALAARVSLLEEGAVAEADYGAPVAAPAVKSTGVEVAF
jgi:hypothetical protein